MPRTSLNGHSSNLHRHKQAIMVSAKQTKVPIDVMTLPTEITAFWAMVMIRK